MAELQRKQILSAVSPENFIGRTRELEMLLRRAKDSEPRGLLLLSAPALGASELLRQTYDQIFFEQKIVPFYFSIRKSDKTADQAALRFLQTFIRQAVAFRRQDANILDSSHDICELSQLALPSDGYWIDRLVEICRIESPLNDKRAFIKNCLSAPLRAATRGARSFVIIDNLHETAHFSDEYDFIGELSEIYARSNVPYVLAGRRRFSFGDVQGQLETVELEPLSFSDAGLLAADLASGAEINEQTRDLIAVQFDGKPAFIRFLFQTAKENKSRLDSFQKIEKTYANEIFGGRIAKFYDRVFDEISPSAETHKNILGLLYDALTIETEKTPVEFWQKRMDLNDEEFYRTIKLLNTHEIIRLTSNHVEAMEENRMLSDYLMARFRLEVITENRALVVGEMLSDFLKRAPQLMARFYRKNSAIGLRELLSVFDLQTVPLSLLDYSVFRDELKGAPNEEVLKYLKNETDKERLPQIVYTAHTVAIYPPIEQVTESERSAVALGFAECTYTDEDEIVWIAAEIDAKLEASRELTEFWCDRLEMVALMCNFLRYKLWLVAPEGFSPEAVEILKQRGAFGSSKKQVELLIKLLEAEKTVGEKIKPNEYEMVVPMGEDTELIAAQAIEEIALRYNVSRKEINQTKTALVEACINAAEHSLSPDRKIYLKFTIDNHKINLDVSNRGLRLTDKKAREVKPVGGKRGWGYKLMNSLMDEVKIEQTDDGTRISMVKYLEKR